MGGGGGGVIFLFIIIGYFIGIVHLFEAEREGYGGHVCSFRDLIHGGRPCFSCMCFVRGYGGLVCLAAAGLGLVDGRPPEGNTKHAVFGKYIELILLQKTRIRCIHGMTSSKADSKACS